MDRALPGRPRQPVHLRVATVLANCSVGAYARLVLDAPKIAGRALPGQFVTLAVGEEPTSTLLRRAFSIHASGGGLVELVVAAHGVGSTWVTRRRPGDAVDVVGPLGRPFPAPGDNARVVLVGGGYGFSPMLWFGERLEGHEVDIVVGAASADRLFGVEEAAKVVGTDRMHVTTDDGSAGTRGRVTDVLGPLLGAATAGHGDPPAEVYACGPMPMLRAVAAVAAEHGAVAWCAVEELMACGIGVCLTCVLPVRGADGVTRMTRTCTEGPALAGDTIRWDSIGGQQ